MSSPGASSGPKILMKLHVVHRTSYQYAQPVSESFNEVRLKPVSADGQTCDACVAGTGLLLGKCFATCPAGYGLLAAICVGMWRTTPC